MEMTPQGYTEKHARIVEICEGRRVLHLGCVGFTDSPVEEKVRLAKKSLHQRLTDCCDCTGVDLDRDSVMQLQERGIFKNVLVGDAEALEQLDATIPKFDLAVAGDIIEHLSNPGRMLDGVKRWLKPDGLLLVSTPNAFGLPGYVRFVMGRYREGLQHVLAFNSIVLEQLLKRHGYEITNIWTCHQPAAAGGNGLLFKLGRIFFSCFPKFGGTLLVVAKIREPAGQV